MHGHQGRWAHEHMPASGKGHTKTPKANYLWVSSKFHVQKHFPPVDQGSWWHLRPPSLLSPCRGQGCLWLGLLSSGPACPPLPLKFLRDFPKPTLNPNHWNSHRSPTPAHPLWTSPWFLLPFETRIPQRQMILFSIKYNFVSKLKIKYTLN